MKKYYDIIEQYSGHANRQNESLAGDGEHMRIILQSVDDN